MSVVSTPGRQAEILRHAGTAADGVERWLVQLVGVGTAGWETFTMRADNLAP